MRRAVVWSLWTLWLAGGTAMADLKVMVAIDPSDRETMLISLLDMRSNLSKVTGQPVSAITPSACAAI